MIITLLLLLSPLPLRQGTKPTKFNLQEFIIMSAKYQLQNFVSQTDDPKNKARLCANKLRH